MADNVIADPGTGGATFRTDDDGTAHWPYTKLAYGADNTQNIVTSTTTNPLPVALSDTDNAVLDTIDAVLDTINAKLVSGTVIGDVNLGATDNAVLDSILSALQGTLTVGSHAVTNAGTFAVQVDGAALTALQLIDDAVYTDATGTPSKGIAVMGTDGTNPQLLSVDATGHAQVDVLTSALPSGAATEAKQDTLIGHVDGVEASLTDAVTALQIIDDWDETNRAKVNLIVGQAGITAGAGAVGLSTPRMTLASDDPAVALLTTIDADTGNLTAIKTAVELIDNAISGTEMQVDVVAALPTGTNTIGNVTVTAQATGGCSYFRSIDLDETEEEVKASAGTLYGGVVMNLKATVLYLKFYNATAANVTVGTTTPVLTIPVPSPGDTSGAGFNIPLPTCGVQFDTAITIACTTGIADNDTGAPGANECIVNLFFE